MTTFKQTCLKRHEVTSKLNALHQCRATLAEHHIKTSGVDSLIESKTREIESLTLDISDRKARLDKYRKVYFDRRTIELPREISSLRSAISRGQEVIDRKRLALTESGIEAEEAVRLFPDYDGAHVLEQVAPLENELDSWESFSGTGLVSDLPDNVDALFERIGMYPTEATPRGARNVYL